MNFHQRSFSEQQQPLRPQQAPSFGLNNSSNDNGIVSMDTSREPTSGGGEILHSDSQQSLDRLFNPTNMPSYTPLRDRNLPASFFSPPWKATSEADEQDGEPLIEPKREHPPVQSYHSRSVSYDHRRTISMAPRVRVSNNLRNGQPAFGADRAASIHHQRDNSLQQPVTSYTNTNNGHFVDGQYQQPTLSSSSSSNNINNNNNNSTNMTNHHEPKFAQQIHHATNNHSDQHHEPKFQVTHATNHHIQHHEPKFHVAHSTYVTSAQPVQQQLPATATIVPPFNPADQLCTTTTTNSNEFASWPSTMSHSCSNSDFHSGSCSSLHSRSQSCQSSVLDSSMSNLGISGSSSDLTRETTVTPMFDYATTAPTIVQQQQQQQQQQPIIPNGGSYNHQAQQQQQMFGAQNAINHHQHFQNQMPVLQQPQQAAASIEERRCGY